MKDFKRLNQHFELMVNTPDLMWLGQNSNHFPTHPVVLDAMFNSIKDEDIHVYAPPFGLEVMKITSNKPHMKLQTSLRGKEPRHSLIFMPCRYNASHT